MTRLILHAPKRTTQADEKRSFDRIVATGIGEGYILSRRERELCYPGCQVVILSKDERRRAEGICVKIIPTYKANNYQQRYDIYISMINIVPYHNESLNRNGVAVIT